MPSPPVPYFKGRIMKNILVVDDAPDMRRLLMKRLESAGYKVEQAVNIPEAKERLSQIIPDCILLDIMLPGAYGTSWCDELKGDDRYKQIPIIIISAKDRAIDREISAMVKADAFIAKPFNMAEVIKKIEEVLSRIK